MFEAFVQYLSDDVLGLPDDQVRCVLLLLAGYPLALVLRHVLHPSRTPLSVRHLFSSLSGLALVTLCYGWQVLVLIAGVGVGYIILLTTPPQLVQRWSMVWVVGFMSCGHLYRTLTDYGGWHLDVTGPMMILVQKLSLVAFAVHDGMGGNSKPLNQDQEKQKLISVPSVLEYMSYCFNFHSVLAGPSVTMREHLDFMDGSNLLLTSPASSTKPQKEPSALRPVLTKLMVALLSCAFHVILIRHSYPLPIDPSMSVFVKVAYFCLVTHVIQARFYFVFILSDSISNAAGLGFEGYDERNQPKWGLASNYDVIGMAFSMNIRNSINLWNIKSALWLRRVCYERVSWNPTVASFLLSAWWHGFYPGYYLCFFSFGISLMAAKKMRRLCNPFFTGRGPVLRWTYHVATWVLTQVFVAYCSLQLVLMWPSRIWILYKYHYFVPTVAPLLVVLLLPSEQSLRHKTPTDTNGEFKSGVSTETKSTKRD